MPSCTSGPVLPLPLSKIRLPGTPSRQNSPVAARYGSRAKSFWEAAAGVSSLGEFCYLPGLLLLLRLVVRSRLQNWSWRRDLNPRPSDYKSDALPAELRQRAALSSGISPDRQNPPCLPGQLSRLTQGTSPCNRRSNPRNALKPFAFVSNGDLPLATPAGPGGWGFCRARPPSADAVKRSLSFYPISSNLTNSAVAGFELLLGFWLIASC